MGLQDYSPITQVLIVVGMFVLIVLLLLLVLKVGSRMNNILSENNRKCEFKQEFAKENPKFQSKLERLGSALGDAEEDI